MKYLTLLLGITLAAGAIANTSIKPNDNAQPAVSVPSLEVKHRLMAIEQINVTAEKTAVPLDDAELQAILNEAHLLEQMPQQPMQHPTQQQSPKR